MRDQILLLAALRRQNLDFATALGAQRLGEQRPVLDIVRDQDQARRRLVVVELREERREDFAGAERPVGLGKIGAISPVLSGAEKEHLDAAEPALLVDGKNVR